MPKKTKTSSEDIELFLAAIKGTTPLAQKKIRQSKIAPPIKHKVKIRDEQDAPQELFQFRDDDYLPPIRSEDPLSYKKAGVPDKTLRKLRKGQYNVEARLDLHGMTIEKARIAVDHFLQQCLLTGISVALIIHGKGMHSQMPILKNKLNNWLPSTDIVLAFCSALPQHGGLGAAYVLLKNTIIKERFA
jgi:DNA-nicking Smr family endonuclease